MTKSGKKAYNRNLVDFGCTPFFYCVMFFISSSGKLDAWIMVFIGTPRDRRLAAIGRCIRLERFFITYIHLSYMVTSSDSSFVNLQTLAAQINLSLRDNRLSFIRPPQHQAEDKSSLLAGGCIKNGVCLSLKPSCNMV